jgi:hypothetical protein
VDANRPFEHFSEEQKRLRNRLRARARQAGDQRKPSGEQEIDQLTQELAYEYWHRMLFARFLAENHLLMHPDGVAVSLAECEELAKLEGVDNGWALAARYASRMLPQIFRIDDVLLEIEFPINDRLPLEKLLASLPPETFTADDSLGWVYQFWQSKRKAEVNKSGEKIDGRTLPAVTQLFTEPYMVKFLLHNTIGTWWCARHGIKGPPGGAGVPAGQAPVEMEYLRWRDDGTPAAGSFDGWPKTLKEFTMLDPCCGSGHFLVEAFRLLVPLRMRDEGLSAREACDAVLSENLFGLEIDPRCTQIAAFALALAAWKYPNESGQPLGYRPLPPLNIACSGLSVTGRKEEWLALANGDSRLLEGMDKLYDLFRQAPHLGSLIDPRREVGDLIVAGFIELQPLLEKALNKQKIQEDTEAVAVGVTAHGIAEAAMLLAKQYTLVATNVPYLGRKSHGHALSQYAEGNEPDAKAELAMIFASRSFRWLTQGGTVALVTPQNWLFLKTYSRLRTRLLREGTWNLVAKLGPAAFSDMNWWAANTSLIVITNFIPSPAALIAGFDISPPRDAEEKAALLRGYIWQPTDQKGSGRFGGPSGRVVDPSKKTFELTDSDNVFGGTPDLVNQEDQLKNPDARIIFKQPTAHELLEQYVNSFHGLTTGDLGRMQRCFWEMANPGPEWVRFQSTVRETLTYGGRESLLYWCDATGPIQELPGSRMDGTGAWKKHGVVISQMRHLPATLYLGDAFDNNTAVLIPREQAHLPALWAFCSSPEYNKAVRRIDQKVNVTNATLVKVPFDLDRWTRVAQEKYPNGLPKPYSDDPTQWIFHGHPAQSDAPLQVAVARLLGYRWPAEQDSAMELSEEARTWVKKSEGLLAHADRDGIVCIPAVRGERPAAERLLDILRTAYGSRWSDAILHKLLTDAGCKPGTSLDDWLRDKFFEQHCKRFHHRPFIWHIWDGRKDGFSCLVNYHRLDHQRLETLTYAYLQDWITAQAAAARDGKLGADLRLAAAQELQSKLKLILAGEPPYDIFVRWKPIHEQPIGWNPDLNDGVRVNIRPFVMANVLRKPPNIKWTKDRGKEPERAQEQFPWFWENGTFKGDRINDYHLTNAQKRAARERLDHG